MEFFKTCVNKANMTQFVQVVKHDPFKLSGQPIEVSIWPSPQGLALAHVG